MRASWCLRIESYKYSEISKVSPLETCIRKTLKSSDPSKDASEYRLLLKLWQSRTIDVLRIRFGLIHRQMPHLPIFLPPLA
jgi:hypothetical protein